MKFSIFFLQITTPTCPQFCRIIAPNPDTSQTFFYYGSERLRCNNSIIKFDGLNNDIFYNITIEVGNSAGSGYSTGTLILSEWIFHGLLRWLFECVHAHACSIHFCFILTPRPFVLEFLAACCSTQCCTITLMYHVLSLQSATWPVTDCIGLIYSLYPVQAIVESYPMHIAMLY